MKNAPAPWGDYGSILISGMCYRDSLGRLVIERTAPFVPPITESGVGILVVTDALRRELEGSGLTGFEFEPIEKKRIVKLDWLDWDQEAEEPQRYPAGSEPENYILGRKHNEALAAQIGELWGVVPRRLAKGGRQEEWARDEDIWLTEDSIPPEDLYMAEGIYGWIFASPAAKFWLERRASGWLSFRPARIESQ